MRRPSFLLLLGLLTACGQLASRTPPPPGALVWGPAPQLPQAAAGGTVGFTAALRLEGGSGPQTVALSLSGAPGVSVLPAKLSLEAGDSYPLNLTLALPKTLGAGTYPLRLKAQSGSLEAELGLSLQVTGVVENPGPGQPLLGSFTANPAQLSLRGGPVTLSWSGQAQGYTLSVSPPDGVSVNGQPYGGPVSFPGEATGASLEFAANPGPTTTYTLTLKALGETGSTPVQESLQVRVQGGVLWLAGNDPALSDDAVLFSQGLFGLLGGATPSLTPALKLPGQRIYALAFDPQGNLWVASSDREGDVLEAYTAASLGQPNPTPWAQIRQGISGPSALAFDPQGNLWVANAWNGNVTAYAAARLADDPAPMQTLKQGLHYPLGLAFDTAGNLWVSNNFSSASVNGGRGAIFGYTQDSLGTANPQPAATLTRGVNSPAQIAFDPQGNLWTIEQGAQPGRWLTRHPVEGLWQDSDPTEPFFDLPDLPSALAFDPEGRLWLAVADTLYGYTPDALNQPQPTATYRYTLGGEWTSLAFQP